MDIGCTRHINIAIQLVLMTMNDMNNDDMSSPFLYNPYKAVIAKWVAFLGLFLYHSLSCIMFYQYSV